MSRGEESLSVNLASQTRAHLRLLSLGSRVDPRVEALLEAQLHSVVSVRAVLPEPLNAFDVAVGPANLLYLTAPVLQRAHNRLEQERRGFKRVTRVALSVVVALVFQLSDALLKSFHVADFIVPVLLNLLDQLVDFAVYTAQDRVLTGDLTVKLSGLSRRVVDETLMRRPPLLRPVLAFLVQAEIFHLLFSEVAFFVGFSGIQIFDSGVFALCFVKLEFLGKRLFDDFLSSFHIKRLVDLSERIDVEVFHDNVPAVLIVAAGELDLAPPQTPQLPQVLGVAISAEILAILFVIVGLRHVFGGGALLSLFPVIEAVIIKGTDFGLEVAVCLVIFSHKNLLNSFFNSRILSVEDLCPQTRNVFRFL